MKTTTRILLVLVMAFAAVPLLTPAVHAECCLTTLGSPCPVERPATICSKFLNTVAQPLGAVEDIFTIKPATIFARAYGIVANSVTLPGNLIGNAGCCGTEVVDHAPGIEPVCGLALTCPSCL
ncbi:MAG: hypothetical protein ACP5SH_03715 [Syntrophobacteraceae bacterium]